MPPCPSKPPLIYRSLSEVPGCAPHQSYVCAFSARRGTWRCDGCQQPQKPGTWRYWHHAAEVCGGAEDSVCYAGPFCPHCAELPTVAEGVYP